MNIKTEVRPADAEGIARAAELLRRGELVALPTETVYGIAADARNGEAVSKIFVAKGRPQDSNSALNSNPWLVVGFYRTRSSGDSR